MILYDYALKMPDAFLSIVCQSSDVLQRMIILSVRALDTDHSKERTSQRLTQIPLSRAKMKGISRVFFYHRYLGECLVSRVRIWQLA